ncbi:DUF2913 family protein [Serratia ureilytica]|uniref:DUF2913 family protein n=1 Tax=Serratia ureilytica TaxID=300181 RepID=UPI0018D9C6F5|nr:DUF2913 family protein [Serratia ureilytica]MBH3156849.1 DUF2913 family protein [Serratia ureilytica]MBH3251961.1 DUF2913 family protein [Serratia ureilytica]
MATQESETEITLSALGNLAFCALVALGIARQDGIAGNPLAEHLFLVRWLATAQKQKRFPKSVASDISLLLKKGRDVGLNCNLRRKIKYIWSSCTTTLNTQSDLFRLTYVTEQLRDKGWKNYILDSKAWRNNLNVMIPQTSGYYIEKSALHNAYSDTGRLIHPIEICFFGDIDLLITLMTQSGIRTKTLEIEDVFHRIILIPSTQEHT